MNFQEILSPIKIDDFLSTYHEKKELIIKRKNSQYFDDILNIKQLSNYLSKKDIAFPSLRVVKEGFELNKELYQINAPIGYDFVKVIDNDKVFTLFNDNSTIVIQAGQRYFPNLRDFCLELNTFFGSPVQANIYITPKSSQGFTAHWDTHDVFVLQITGSKIWRLYDSPHKLPTKNQKSNKLNFEGKEPIAEFEINAGDLLYIPRGLVHDAISTDTISTHITIGVLSYTWHNLFLEYFSQLENELDLRTAIPYWNEEKLKLELEQKINLICSNLKENNQWLNIAHNLSNNSIKTRVQSDENRFENLFKIDSITIDSILKISKRVKYSVSYDEKVILSFYEKNITFPIFSKSIIEEILLKKTFSLSQLNNSIDDSGKIFLAKKLIIEGFLTFNE